MSTYHDLTHIYIFWSNLESRRKKPKAPTSSFHTVRSPRSKTTYQKTTLNCDQCSKCCSICQLYNGIENGMSEKLSYVFAEVSNNSMPHGSQTLSSLAVQTQGHILVMARTKASAAEMMPKRKAKSKPSPSPATPARRRKKNARRGGS